jgi:putative ABC transport system permease protein
MSWFIAWIWGRLPIGWLQLMHNKARLIAAVGGVTFANVLIFMQLGFMNALFETSVFSHRSFDADIVIVNADFRSLREANPLPRSRMYQALAVTGVRSATAIYMGTRFWTDDSTGDTTNFRVIGVDPNADVFAQKVLAEKTRVLRVQDTAIVDQRTRAFNATIRATLVAGGKINEEIGGRTISFIGLFDQGASFDVDGSLIVSDQTFLRLFPNRRAGTPTLILLKVDNPAKTQEITEHINLHLAHGDVRAMTKNAFIDAEQSYQATQTPIGFVFSFGVAIGMVVGLVIVYQVLSTDVQDHLSEYATFKAIGYPNQFFFGVVLEEALSLAALGFLPGLAICLVLYQLAAAKTGLPITMPWSRPLFVFFLTVIMCILSGVIATRRLNAADPAELF